MHELQKSRDSFSLLHIKDAMVATFKKRPGPNRKFILILLCFVFTSIGPYFGEFAILYLFVRTKFGWRVNEYSRYSGIVSGLGILGKLTFVEDNKYKKVVRSRHSL